ncbi:hypothetical protein MASR1M49_36570 [Pararhodobacter aggregans]
MRGGVFGEGTRPVQEIGLKPAQDARFMGADGQAVDGDLAEILGRVDALRLVALIVLPVARHIERVPQAVGRAVQQRTGVAERTAHRGQALGLALMDQHLLRQPVDGGGAVQQRPVGHQQVLTRPCPFEYRHGDRRAALQDQAADLGVEERREDAVDLQPVILRIDRARDVETQRQRKAAGAGGEGGESERHQEGHAQQHRPILPCRVRVCLGRYRRRVI